MKILLVDDDVELADMLAEYLRSEGFSAGTAQNGEIGVVEALSGTYDLIVLDVMMPGMNGIEALGRIRLKSRVPVLMLTAKGDDLDRIIGLELGADDYVPKPCTPRELTARIRAILRRTQANASAGPENLTEGDLWMQPQRRHVSWAGQTVDLTSTEYSLLEVLVRNAGRVVSKHELSESALGRPLARFDRSIDVHLSSIRHKLSAFQGGDGCIQTVRGRGYLFVKA